MTYTAAVRSFQAQDIPQVAELHRKVFRIAIRPSSQLADIYRPYLNEFLSDNSGIHSGVHSLVSEGPSGSIIGFLGVKPQPMWIRNRPLLAAVSSQFIVDDNCRSTMAGVQLLKTFLAGPQELSIVDEASQDSRNLWHRFGGSTAYLQSICWARVLQPAQFLLSRLKLRHGAALLQTTVSPILRIADGIVTALPGNPFTVPRNTETVEDPPLEELLACIRDVSGKRELHPDYEKYSLDRILANLGRRREHGPLRKGIVRDAGKKATGWFIYHAKRGGLGEVLQIGAEGDSHGKVLDHLFYDAMQNGVAALSGRMESEFMDELWRKHCIFHHRGYWTLIHSKNAEALQAIHRGDAFLTRLEGEWPMRFEIPELHSKIKGEQSGGPLEKAEISGAFHLSD